jgi:mRNA interferase HicA
MKRRDLLKHLSEHGCRFVREGSEHSVWENPNTKQRSSVPRHSEVNDFTANRICKSLGVPKP